MNRKYKQNLTLLLFVFPALAVYVVFKLYPAVSGLFYSMTDWNGLNQTYDFIGFENFVEIFSDTYFWQAMGFTFRYVTVMLVVANGMALGLSVAIESRQRGKGVYRTIFYMPNMISMIIGGYMWRFLFTKVLYYMADHWELKFLDQSWVGDSRFAFLSIIIVAAWGAVGYLMIIYIAALQEVPPQLKEAASLVGAGPRQRFYYVILPMIRPALTIGLFTLSPFILALLNSIKTNGELLSNVISFPSALRFENYRNVLDKTNYFPSLGNTVFLSVLGVTLMILFSAMAGWKLCRTKTRLSAFLFALFVFSMLIPFSSIVIPLYKVVLALGIKNSLTGLSFVYAGLGASMAVFLYHGFVKNIPIEMEEAAAIDGCNSLSTFFRIVFPSLKSITATVCITNVLWIWNDFLLPLIVISDNRKYTLLLSTNTLFGRYGSDWTAILSALILAALPVIVFYGVFQKQIMKGIADSSIKG